MIPLTEKEFKALLKFVFTAGEKYNSFRTKISFSKTEPNFEQFYKKEILGKK